MEFKLDKALLKNPDFTIVANNCWGAEVYKTFDLPFNTPIIGLYFYPDCFIKLLSDFQENIHSELKFTPQSKYHKEKRDYPVGLLRNDIEIHFLHYKNEEEAFQKWTKRAKRISTEDSKLFFKFDDRDGCKPSHIRQFHDFPFRNKISFSVQKHPEIPENINIPMKKEEQAVMDGLLLYYESVKYFDIIKWLNGEGVQQNFGNKFKHLMSSLKTSFD